jgi:hypothetical protein
MRRLSGSLWLKSPIIYKRLSGEPACLQAIEIARRQEAKSLELRAMVSLSRLWQQQGEKGDAQQMLAEIYD